MVFLSHAENSAGVGCVRFCLCTTVIDAFLKGQCRRVERNAEYIVFAFSELHQTSTHCMSKQQPSVGKVGMKQLILQRASLFEMVRLIYRATLDIGVTVSP